MGLRPVGSTSSLSVLSFPVSSLCSLHFSQDSSIQKLLESTDRKTLLKDAMSNFPSGSNYNGLMIIKLQIHLGMTKMRAGKEDAYLPLKFIENEPEIMFCM